MNIKTQIPKQAKLRENAQNVLKNRPFFIRFNEESKNLQNPFQKMINEDENSEEFEKKAKILRVEPGDQNRAKPMKFETFFKERNGNWVIDQRNRDKSNASFLRESKRKGQREREREGGGQCGRGLQSLACIRQPN